MDQPGRDIGTSEPAPATGVWKRDLAAVAASKGSRRRRQWLADAAGPDCASCQDQEPRRYGGTGTAAAAKRGTHTAPACLDVYATFGRLLELGLSGRPLPEMMVSVVAEVEKWPAVAPILTDAWRDKHRRDIGLSGYGLHSLEAAICWRGANN